MLSERVIGVCTESTRHKTPDGSPPILRQKTKNTNWYATGYMAVEIAFCHLHVHVHTSILCTAARICTYLVYSRTRSSPSDQLCRPMRTADHHWKTSDNTRCSPVDSATCTPSAARSRHPNLRRRHQTRDRRRHCSPSLRAIRWRKTRDPARCSADRCRGIPTSGWRHHLLRVCCLKRATSSIKHDVFHRQTWATWMRVSKRHKIESRYCIKAHSCSK